MYPIFEIHTQLNKSTSWFRGQGVLGKGGHVFLPNFSNTDLSFLGLTKIFVP